MQHLDNIQSCRSSILGLMVGDCEDASKFARWQIYGPCRGQACSTWSFGCFMQQMQALEENLGVAISEMRDISMSVQAFATELLCLENKPFPVDKSHTCKFEDFKYRISQRLYDVDLGDLLEHGDYFQKSIFTPYNHVLGSMLTTTGMLPLDFEMGDLEEMDETFRPSMDLIEPLEEYSWFDAATINADLFDEFPVSDADDDMDIDTAVEESSENDDEESDDDSEDDDEGSEDNDSEER
jgi:hypothetical protein